jgi:hypothetical protein
LQDLKKSHVHGNYRTLIQDFDSLSHSIDSFHSVTPPEFSNLEYLDRTIQTFFDPPLQESEREVKGVQRLHRFLVAKSLMDCSLLIRFESSPLDTSFHCLPIDSNSEETPQLYYSVSVVDVEPKSVHKLETYRDQAQSLDQLVQSLEFQNYEKKHCQ